MKIQEQIFLYKKDDYNLITYIDKNLSTEFINKYYIHFVSKDPSVTLDIFKKAIDNNAELNTGCNHYEYINSLFRKMNKLEIGK